MCRRVVQAGGAGPASPARDVGRRVLHHREMSDGSRRPPGVHDEDRPGDPPLSRSRRWSERREDKKEEKMTSEYIFILE